jgi:hypothetical protein
MLTSVDEIHRAQEVAFELIKGKTSNDAMSFYETCHFGLSISYRTAHGDAQLAETRIWQTVTQSIRDVKKRAP